MSFKRLDPEDFTFGVDSVVAPAWSSNTSSLTSFFTSSIQQGTNAAQYYADVYNINPSIPGNPKIQFSIAYGDADGSGSLWYNPLNPGASPSRTVYGQFVNLLLGEDEGASFDFGERILPSTSFFVITLNRANYKQSIMPGSLKIRGIINNNFFESLPPLNPNSFITDNSLLVSAPDYTAAGRRYDLGVSTLIGRGVPYRFGSGVIKFGYLYPDIGIIILNPSALRGSFTNSSNINGNNSVRLVRFFTEFSLLSQETISSNYIFCRAQNHEFNFSTQPNFISSTRNITGSSDATLNDFVQTPPTYITSVGLYNDNNELLAVAKLSKPLKKDFTTEALIRVKLDF
jgi:hypothetical protein